MKQCIDIPRGWQRVVKSQTVIYVTPSLDELKSKDDILHYLTSPGTCKCGLKCPLHLDSLFSFDAAIKSKELQIQDKPPRHPVNHIIEKQGKPYSATSHQNATVKGPPISHSCNLKTVKPSKTESVKALQNTPAKTTVTNSQGNSVKESSKSVRSPLPQRPVESSLGSTPMNQLPPISVFCQVNKHTVQQVLQHLYSSLENRTLKHRSPFKQLQNPDVANVPKEHSKIRSPGISGPRNMVVSQEDHEMQKQHSNCVKPPVNPPHPSEQHGTIRSIVPKPPKANGDHKVPPHILHVGESANGNQVYKHASSSKKLPEKILQSDSSNCTHDLQKVRPKQQKGPGNMLQIVQSESNRGHNNVRPPHYVQTHGIHPSSQHAMNYYAMNQQALHQQAINQQALHQHAMNQQAMLRMPGFNPPPYGIPLMVRPLSEHPPDDKRSKSKAKSKSKQPPKVSKQPAIVIQPDQGKIRINSSSKPTLLVSLGESLEKKGDKVVPKKLCPTPSDANLTSVDSILKTCSNPNLGNIPDIDHDSELESFPKENVTSVSKISSSEQSPKLSTSNTPTAQYSNSMIPVQYLTPGSLVYGVPLIQNDSRQNREHKSSKSVEKWEGVLSPSEVDAKVQQILSSPQKSEEPTQAADKELSPKKRKREQSAPHMYDRYPGNPALRFQTGNSTKSAKLSKSEPHIPSNVMLNPTGTAPIVHPIPVSGIPHPHWGQFQPPIPAQNFPVFQAMPGHMSMPDHGNQVQVDGRKSH